MAAGAQGTAVRITLPKAEVPRWFIARIDVSNYPTVVILDDDPSIHEVWTKRLTGKNLIHLSSSVEFTKWYRNNFASSARTLYLCDFELSNRGETGLDLIDKCRIVEDAILVTGKWDDKIVRNRAEKLGVKVLPKNVAHLVPLDL